MLLARDRAQNGPDSSDDVEGAAGAPDGGVAVEEEVAAPREKTLPPFKVLLHNDDVNEFVYVVATIVELTPLTAEEAFACTLEAHENRVSLLLVTHKERAELYCEQFASRRLTVTTEPDA